MRQAGFPVVKRLEEFDVAASSIRPATFDYLASVEWIRAAENVCMIGPAGTGKSHTLIGWDRSGRRGNPVRYFTAAELVETLDQALGQQLVGEVIETLLRNGAVLVDELWFSPLDVTGTQLLFAVRRRRLRTQVAGIASDLPFQSGGRFLPEYYRGQHARPPPGTATPCHHRCFYPTKQARAKGGNLSRWAVACGT